MKEARIPWVKCPCRGCGERSAECHADCKPYKEYAEFQRLRKAGYRDWVDSRRPTHYGKLKMEANFKKEAKGK